jgi:DNA-binding SARP family transcriptional activator
MRDAGRNVASHDVSRRFDALPAPWRPGVNRPTWHIARRVRDIAMSLRTSAMFVKLLGPVGIATEASEEPRSSALGTGKPMVLLARLVVEPRGVTRAALAEFLWPGTDPKKARASVRQAIHVVRRSLGETALLEHDERVSVSPDIRSDWQRLQAATAQRDDAAVLGAYGGAFLEDVPLQDLHEVDQWIELERARLMRAHARAAHREIARLMAASEPRSALMVAERLCALYPSEPAHWAARLTVLRAGGEASRLVEALDILVHRMLGGQMDGMDRARAILREHADAAVQAGLPARLLGAALESASSDDHDDPGESAGVLTLFRTPAFPGPRIPRLLTVRSGPPSPSPRAGGGLLRQLLAQCGIQGTTTLSDPVPLVREALEGLTAGPHHIRLHVAHPEECVDLMAIREAARTSRGTCLLVQVELQPAVHDMLRWWRQLVDEDPERVQVRKPVQLLASDANSRGSSGPS